MWNYPFDPNEIEGEDRESTFMESVLMVLGGFTVLYFGTHFLVFIFN